MKKTFLLKLLQGALIGLGSVLPGISGGVLSVIFGVYKPIMELLANPRKNFKTHIPMLLPVILGSIIGFLGIANLLGFLLSRYPDQSVCVFVGLIGGMLPSLFREAGEKGRKTSSFLAMLIAMSIVFALLISLRLFSVSIEPGFSWYIFCGFCLALSIIAPGMSFSTLLMPLNLYTPFVDGIGHFSMEVLIPGAIGGLITIITLSKAINALFDKYYSISFHAIVGIVIAATVMIIPFQSFAGKTNDCLINLFCICAGIVAAQVLDRFNNKPHLKHDCN